MSKKELERLLTHAEHVLAQLEAVLPGPRSGRVAWQFARNFTGRMD